MTPLVYVYAVLRNPVAAKLAGINGQPVRWISASSVNLAAAVSDVPAAEFDEEPLNEGIRNMAWLGPRAVAHQEVNSRLHEAAEAIVPLAFGTVFRDDERVRQLLCERWENLGERLAAVHAAGEWVLAVHLLREPAAEVVAQTSPAIQALRAEVDSSGPGRAHLLRRRMAEVERAEARRFSDDAAEEAVASLSTVAADIFREPLPADSVERPLLRASILVRRDREAQFLEVVERLQAQFAEPTYRLLLTGPWPPYRFGGISTRTGLDG